MSAIEQLLDKAKESSSIASDMALAARIGRSRALLSEWRKGAKQVQNGDIARLAKLAHVDGGEWQVRINAEQDDGDAAKNWQAIMKKLASVAAMMLIAVLFVPEAHAGTHEAAAVGSGLLLWLLRIMCIMSFAGITSSDLATLERFSSSPPHV